MNRSQALLLLSECTGDDIWSVEHCRNRNVPANWISELRDAYESGFASDSQTIYFQLQPVNQFEGVRDVDLACKIGRLLRIDVSQILSSHSTRREVVRAIREAIEES
jgi:hypothetical protein